MIDISKIDLGNDEAEQDNRLKEYFLKTSQYKNVLSGKKTIVIGRKGSGKSAIFALLSNELENENSLIIPITPDQYSWSALRDYEEQGILAEQAHTNAWKMTLLASIIYFLKQKNFIGKKSKLSSYYDFMKDAYNPKNLSNVSRLLDGLRNINSVSFSMLGVGWNNTGTIATPLKIINEIKQILIDEFPENLTVRILIDRLDDSWDASDQSKNLIIGLLKALSDINSSFSNKIVVTAFLRSDIYDYLIFGDKDKFRQYEERLSWGNNDLKAIISERVRVSLKLDTNIDQKDIWDDLFSGQTFRSHASAEKFIIDKTFKRPRDIISFLRFALEIALRNNHSIIENDDVKLAVEIYSKSKYEDLIIEYDNQFPHIKDVLDMLSRSLHRLSRDEFISKLDRFIRDKNIDSYSPSQLINLLFILGVLGIKQTGGNIRGSHFVYYYDNPSISPLKYSEYYIHPSLRHYLGIIEAKTKSKANNI